MGKLLELIIGIFSGGAGQTIGKAATFAGIVAALTPVAFWIAANKDVPFVTVTYGQLAFWGAMIAVNLVIAFATNARKE